MITRPRFHPSLVAALAVLGACVHPGAGVARVDRSIGRGTLRATIDSVASAPAFRNAHWGILIVDPDAHDTIYSRNAGKLFIPASNMKVITGGTALLQLGAAYTYRTSFVARGPVRGGVLAGDLAVIGRGDPTVSDHMRGDAMIPLRAIADSIAARGITRIGGRVTPAGDAFSSPTLGFGWSWDDLESSYSAAVDELMFNEGFSEVRVRGGAREGDSVHVETRPASTFPALRVAVHTVARPAPDCATAAAPQTQPCTVVASAARHPAITARKDTVRGDVIVEGEIAAGDSAVIEVTHRDPDLAYAAALTEALRARGITVDSAPAYASASIVAGDTLATLVSPPLSAILPALLKPSQNQIAEALFRTLGLERGGAGGEDSGRVVVERQLLSSGAAPDGFVIRDGSGLSRYDYLSPETLVHMLDALRKAPDFPIFYDALPIAGVDGSLRSRMRGTSAENNIHAKTGSVANARSLSGYARTADGRLVIFSLLANNWTVPASAVTHAQDVIAAALTSTRLR